MLMMSINFSAEPWSERERKKNLNRQRIFSKVHSLMSGECLELMQWCFSVEKGIRGGFLFCVVEKTEHRKA
jgi:hypothetical protein